MTAQAEFRRLTTTVALIGGLALGSSSAHAVALPINDSGNLLISNLPGLLVAIATNPLCLNWGGGAACVVGTTHPFGVSGSSNLFAVGSVSSQIKDISVGPPPILDFLAVQGGGALSGQTVHFDLTGIPTSPVTVGNCGSNAPLNTCTPANSPFTLQEDATGTQVTMSFAVLLNAYFNASATGFTAYEAIFSTSLSGSVTGFGACAGVAANITNLQNCLTAGGSVRTSWSAAASPGAPPPLPAVPATVTCSATPNSLWPANGNAAAVIVSGVVTQGSNPIAAGGTTYAVTDEYGQIQPSGSFTTGAGGAYSFVLPLIASRNGNDRDGRRYSIAVQVKDTTDTTGSCSTVVTVPHDQGH